MYGSKMSRLNAYLGYGDEVITQHSANLVDFPRPRIYRMPQIPLIFQSNGRKIQRILLRCNRRKVPQISAASSLDFSALQIWTFVGLTRYWMMDLRVSRGGWVSVSMGVRREGVKLCWFMPFKYKSIAHIRKQGSEDPSSFQQAEQPHHAHIMSCVIKTIKINNFEGLYYSCIH